MAFKSSPAKRRSSLTRWRPRTAAPDFADAAEAFSGPVLEIEDTRRDYGERRIMCFGRFRGRLVVVGYVQRGDTRHVFSMRKADDREKERVGQRLG